MTYMIYPNWTKSQETETLDDTGPINLCLQVEASAMMLRTLCIKKRGSVGPIFEHEIKREEVWGLIISVLEHTLNLQLSQNS